MTPQDRELIESVFSRLAQTANAPKDPDALALIAERMRALPDASYGLVQAVLVQESILKQAQTHIADLERRLAEAPAASSGGSFLNAGSSNPWAQSAPPSRPAPPQQQQPAYQPPPYQPAQQASPWGAQPVAGGGFLRQAATAAAGVAGGMLVAEGISSLFSGHHGGFGGGFGGGYNPASGFGGGQPEIVENNTVVNNYYGDSESSPVQSADYSNDDNGLSSDGSDDWL